MSPFDPWLPTLRGLTAELEQALGPWMPAVVAAVGPVAGARAADPTGEPVGWSGIANRGPYERLLLSEWALADAWPDEFLRRAAEREHLFLERDRREPRAAPLTVALFDAGPDQLGAPRLVQLALIVALASRRGAPGRFVVGALHGDVGFEPALDPASGRALGAARTRRTPERGWAEAWRARLEPDAELWVVGSEAATDPPWGRANRVTVAEDVLTGQLQLKVVRADGAVGRATLPAPGRVSASVLHDPFAPRVGVRADGAEVSAMYAGARWLFVRRRAGPEDLLYAVASPDSVRSATKVLGKVAERGRVVGAAKNGRVAASVWVTDTELVVAGVQGSRHVMRRPAEFEAGPLRPALVSGGAVWLQDARGAVWKLDCGQPVRSSDSVPVGPSVGPAWFSHGVASWSDGQTETILASGLLRTREMPGRRLTGLVVGVGLVERPTGIVRHTLHKPAAARVVLAGPWGSAAVGWVGDALLTHDGERGLAIRPFRLEGGVWVPAPGAREVDLGPDPVLWVGPSPHGGTVAVLTRSEVRFFDPRTGDRQCSWEVP